MARSLTLALDQIGRGNTTTRSPAWRVDLYDLRSGLNTISEIVDGSGVNVLTGPHDITPILQQLSISERSGDYVTSGVASTVVTGICVDANQQYDPDSVITDSTALGRYFRQGNVIRVRIGDERVAESEWPYVFTGLIAGQVGYEQSRVGLRASLSFKAYGREATFLPFERTSGEFRNDGTTYIDMAESIAGAEMGLTVDEFNFFGFGSNLLRHKSVTLAKENPMSMLAKIMFTDGFMPRFNGEGVLTQSSGLVTANADRFYETENAFLSISRPQTEVIPPNSVCVVGLDFNLTRIDQPSQVIATMNVTTGYFTDGERLEIYWSDDKTKLADSVIPRVLKSVNGGFSSLGGGEVFTIIPSPSNSLVGSVGMVVTIDTGYAPWIATFLLAIYVVLAAIPDLVEATGFIVNIGFTINVGGIAQAAALAGAMIIMTKLGRGQYEFVGTPFEYVYQTISECAKVEGVGEFEQNEVEIENHLVDNSADAVLIAREMLFRQQARGRPRTVSMFHDLALETDDTFELIESGRRFLVDQIDYTLERGNSQGVIATVRCYEVTDNISRAT